MSNEVHVVITEMYSVNPFIVRADAENTPRFLLY